MVVSLLCPHIAWSRGKQEFSHLFLQEHQFHHEDSHSSHQISSHWGLGFQHMNWGGHSMQSITPWWKETARARVIWRVFHWELNAPDHSDTLIGQNQSHGFTQPSEIQEAQLSDISRSREGQNIWWIALMTPHYGNFSLRENIMQDPKIWDRQLEPLWLKVEVGEVGI